MTAGTTRRQDLRISIDSPAFAYVGDNAHTRFSQLADMSGGLIFGGNAGRAAAHRYRRTDQGTPILFDPAIYSPGKKVAPQLLDPVSQEVASQTALSVAAYLTPSPMPGLHDAASLYQILSQGVVFADRVRADGLDRPVFTTLVLTPEWLTTDLDILTAAIAEHVNPIAIVPASYGDLFTKRGHIEGVLACLEVARGSLMLRTDLSGIGLLAHGSSAVGIGTSTSTRHLYLPRSAKGKRGDREGRAKFVLLGELLHYLRMDELVLHEGDRIFICGCRHCQGSNLLDFADPGIAQESDLHTAAVWRSVLDEILDVGPETRALAWERMCSSALEAFADFVERTSAPFSPPAHLRAWQRPSL